MDKDELIKKVKAASLKYYSGRGKDHRWIKGYEHLVSKDHYAPSFETEYLNSPAHSVDVPLDTFVVLCVNNEGWMSECFDLNERYLAKANRDRFGSLFVLDVYGNWRMCRSDNFHISPGD